MRSWQSAGPAGTTLAVDLGTSSTKIFAPGSGLLIDEPTLLASDRSGEVVAAGREAWRACISTDARLIRPVRRGRPVTPTNCVRFLTLLLERHEIRVDGPVFLAIPAVASEYEASVLAAIPASATGARIVPVESLLAGAIGAGLPMDERVGGLICDVGAGVLELGAIGEGRLLAQSGARIGTAEYLDDPQRLVFSAVGAMHRLLSQVPASTAHELLERPVHVVGGGALLGDLKRDLSDGLRMDVTSQDRPREAVITGLSRCLGRAARPGPRPPLQRATPDAVRSLEVDGPAWSSARGEPRAAVPHAAHTRT